MTNIIDGIQKQCARCRVVVTHYEALGPVGMFGKLMIERDIAEGEAAIASGDVVRMLQAYKALEGCE